MNGLLLLATVPLVTALIGWLTNWSAIKMIFAPKTFVGLGKLGWQGILYKQGEKFATGMADMVQDHLISAKEIAANIDPEEVVSIWGEALEPSLPKLCEDIAAELEQKEAWDALPAQVKSTIAGQLNIQCSKIGLDLLKGMQSEADKFIDVKKIVYQQLSGENISRLARLTKKIASKEFKFIEIYGGLFGFLIGLLQVVVWSVMQTWWLMPLVGVVVGTVTNWLAIQMIFRPQEPKKYFGLFTYQGLFAKRQPDIAKDYGETANAEILTLNVFWDMLSKGESGEAVETYARHFLESTLEKQLVMYKAMLPFEWTSLHTDKARRVIETHVTSMEEKIRKKLDPTIEKGLDVGNVIETRLAALPKPQFELLLRRIFEEDELTLVLVGGFLGGLVGALQGLWLLSF